MEESNLPTNHPPTIPLPGSGDKDKIDSTSESASAPVPAPTPVPVPEPTSESAEPVVQETPKAPEEPKDSPEPELDGPEEVTSLGEVVVGEKTTEGMTAPAVEEQGNEEKRMESGPIQKSNPKAILKIVGMVLVITLIVGGIVYAYLYLRKIPVVQDVVEESSQSQVMENDEVAEEDPKDDNSLKGLRNYFDGVGKDVGVVEDESEFETQLDLSGTNF